MKNTDSIYLDIMFDIPLSNAVVIVMYHCAIFVGSSVFNIEISYFIYDVSECDIANYADKDLRYTLASLESSTTKLHRYLKEKCLKDNTDNTIC